MKTKSGYETNGDYIKFKSGFTSRWNVETENDMQNFKTEFEADMHIIITVLGCEKGYPKCMYYQQQSQGCSNCQIGHNSNCSNSETRSK